MRLEPSFFRSKLTRRIFWLFVLCALLPIGIVALFTFRNVSAQLTEENRKTLSRLTREEAMTIAERLVFLDANLKLIASQSQADSGKGPLASSTGQDALASSLSRQFNGVELVGKDGQRRLLLGKNPPRMVFTADQEAYLAQDNSVLATVPSDRGALSIVLSRRVGSGDHANDKIVAEIKPSYLWNASEFPADTTTCVLDYAGQTLFCSSKTAPVFPGDITKSFSGEFEWSGDRAAHVAQYLNLPLSGSFFTPHWTVVTSQARPDWLAVLVRFRTSLILIALLIVCIILLLSRAQARRNLVPLGKLEEGARKISQGDFNGRVDIETGDEFEEVAISFNGMAGRVEKQFHALKTQNEVDRAILSAWEIDEIVDALSTRLGELIPLDVFSITLFDGEESGFAASYVYEPGKNAAALKQELPVTSKETSTLREHPEVSVGEGIGKLPSYQELLAKCGARFFLTVPILLDGRLAAVICLGHCSASVWDAEDKERAQQLADQVGLSLSNSQLLQKLKMICQYAGPQFEPEVVDVFRRLAERKRKGTVAEETPGAGQALEVV